jgi:endoglycosylceramidase
VPSRRLPALLALVVVAAAVLATQGPSGAGAPVAAERRAATAAEALELLPLQALDRRILDSEGRDVLLRGANVNSLAEYWQGVPEIPTTIPVSDADWDLMASRGFSVIRLLITWSRVEPTRGTYDQAYLDQVEAMVDAAAAHGIYSVIDMHQDAYTATIATTDPAGCPPGTTPAKGWDGAPAWATITNGLSTCLRGGDRNSSPAVEQAWISFYDDVDGIRTSFAAAWGAVAERFAGRPEVAGYDLLNEPENPRPVAEMQAKYDAFLADVTAAIRAAEDDAPFDHIVFVEPAIPAGEPSDGIVIPSPSAFGGDPTNVMASVHNYMESIGNELTIELFNDFIENVTAGLGVGNWGGEYGFWNTEPATIAKALRYAADEDDHLWGGAWWQWRQSCGDPHHVQWQGGDVVAPGGTSTHLNLLGCPGNVDLGPNDAFLDILGRGYPRAAPGRLTEVRSDVATGQLTVRATATEAGGELVVWTPTTDEVPIWAVGLTDVTAHEVEGGRIVTGTVAAPGAYALWVGQADDPAATTTSTTTTTSTSTTSTSTTSTTSTSTTSTTSTLPADPPAVDPGYLYGGGGSTPPATPVTGWARFTG